MKSLYNFLAILTFSRLTRTQDTSSSPSVNLVTISSDPVPTATGPVCTQLRQPTDLPATSIFQSFATASAVPNACNVSLQQESINGLQTIIYYAYGGYTFNISRPTGIRSDEIVSPDQCLYTFNQIITSCISDAAPLYWGGYLSTGITVFSVTNNVFPANPLDAAYFPDVSSSTGVAAPNTALTASGGEYGLGIGTSSVIGDPSTASAGSATENGSGGPASSTDSPSALSTGSGISGAVSSAVLSQGIYTATGINSATDSGLTVDSAVATDSSPSTISEADTYGGMTAATNTATGTESSNPSQTASAIDPGSNARGTNMASSNATVSFGNGGASVPSIGTLSVSLLDTDTALFSLPTGDTEVIATVSSQVVNEIFAPYIIQSLTGLISTLTSTSTDAQGSLITLVVGPGGIAWTPVAQSSGSPDLQPPLNPPPIAIGTPGRTTMGQAMSGSPSASPGSTQSTFAPSMTTGVPIGAATAIDPAILSAAFAGTNMLTTLTAGSENIIYHKSTFSNLIGIPKPTTITTPVVETNRDGSHWTISAAIIIVNTDGSWWNGGIGGFGLKGPSCIWPFCPPGGGGGGGGSGTKPAPDDDDDPPPYPGQDPPPDYDDPDNKTEAEDDNKTEEQQSKTQDDQSQTSQASTPSSTAASTTGASSRSSTQSSSQSSTSTMSTYPLETLEALYSPSDDDGSLQAQAAIVLARISSLGLLIPGMEGGASGSVNSTEVITATMDPSGTSLTGRFGSGNLISTSTASVSSAASKSLTSPATSSADNGPLTTLLTSTSGPSDPGQSKHSDSVIGTAQVSSSPAHTSTVAAPFATDNVAVVLWEEDSCGDLLAGCTSDGRVYQITDFSAKGQQIDVCGSPSSVSTWNFPGSEANENNYQVETDKFTAFDTYKNCQYSGSSELIGSFSCDNLAASKVSCATPSATGTSCSDSNDIQADDWSPLVVCAWSSVPPPAAVSTPPPKQTCKVQDIAGGKAGIVGHVCSCNVGPTPKPTVSGQEYVCPTVAAAKRDFRDVHLPNRFRMLDHDTW